MYLTIEKKNLTFEISTHELHIYFNDLPCGRSRIISDSTKQQILKKFRGTYPQFTIGVFQKNTRLGELWSTLKNNMQTYGVLIG